MAIIKWKPKTELEIENKRAESSLLKQQLRDTDYKIIKSSEYQLVGLESPYDLDVLHEERQTIRDRINTLENF